MKTIAMSALVLVVFSTQPLRADLLSQVDTFDSGTMNWSSGAFPTNISTGGPTGAGDGFLQISRPSTPFHLGVANKTQWAGDYLAAGITALEMDLNYIAGPSPVNVRLLIWGDGGVWASTGVTPVASGWNHYSFGLTASDLILVSLDIDGPNQGTGSGILNDTLSTVNTITLRNDSATPTVPGFHPPHILATLGIDNVDAIHVPETFIYPAIEFGWTTVTGATYQVQYATNLVSTNWFNYGLEVVGDGSTNYVFDSTRGFGKKFYRVIVVP